MARAPMIEDDDVVTVPLTINLRRPLGPQLVPLRALGIPWKMLCDMTGRARSTLQEQHDRAVEELEGLKNDRL